MNFSVTGEPAPSQLDQKRKQLMQTLLSGQPGQQRLLAAGSGRGLSRGYTANDSPNAAVPGLTFNPFLAQMQRGIGNLNAPTSDVRQSISDLTGQGFPNTPFGVPGAQSAQPGGPPIADPGPSGGASPVSPVANPQDLSALMAQSGADPNQAAGGIFRQLWGDVPTTPPPPLPFAPPVPYVRGRTANY